MEFLLLALAFVVMFAYGIYRDSVRLKRRKEQQAIYTETVKAETTEWEARKASNNRFAELYKAENWRGLLDEFGEKDLRQEYDSFDKMQAVALAWSKVGDFDKAERFILLSAQEYSWREKTAFLNMAIMCHDAGENERCIEWIQRASPSQMRAEKAWTDFYRAMRVGAEAFRAMGKVEECAAFLKLAPTTARIIDRDLADILQMLGDCYEEMGQWEKAMKCYQKVVTVRYDKELNAKILELNRLVYETQVEKEERTQFRKDRKMK